MSIIRSGYVDLDHGQVHVRGALADNGLPSVLLLHQNPLSIVTYERVLEPMAAYCRPIAVDTAGFGMSDDPPGPWTIADHAAAMTALVGALGLDRPTLLGQHTGALISIDMTLADPTSYAGLVLVGVPCVDETEAAARLGAKEQYVVADDGSHLRFLWERMQRQYPGIDKDIATRHIVDHLLAGPANYLDAYRAVYTYPIRGALDRLAATRVPVFLLSGSGDCIKDIHDRTTAFLPAAREQTLDGLTDFAMDEDPAAFSVAVGDFLRACVAV